MIQNKLSVLVGVLIAAVLVAYMFAFQVRYDQAAVLTTFDRATDKAVKHEAGLYFKLPWPIQKVHTYDTRVRLLEHRLEQVSTQDGKSIVIRTYLAWRIDDPLAFFIKLQDAGSAHSKLAPLLSEEISAAIGRYRMDQMVNTDQSRVMITKIEEEALENLGRRLTSLGYGIQARQLGIRRLVLPQENTQQVFEAMRQTRQRLASIARFSGQAQADAMTSQARAAKKRILAFAERRAQSIRAEGDKEAAGYYTAFQEDEPLAIFLRRIQTLQAVLPHNTTFILDANQLSLDELLSDRGAGLNTQGFAPRSRNAP